MTPINHFMWLFVKLPLNSHNNSNSDGLAILGLAFLAGIALMYVGAKKWRVGRLIKNTPTEKVRSTAVGRTEVSGTCRDVGITYEKPYADGQCIYRKWQVEEYHRNSGSENDSSEWVVVGGDTDVAPFFVEDDTGEILVDTTEAPTFEISDGNSYSTTVDRGEDPPPEVASFSPDSGGGFLESFAGDVDPGKAMSKVPGMGAAGEMFGGQTVSEMMSQDQQPENVPSSEEAQKQFMQQYFDEEVLDENGQLREDVSEADLKAAMNDDAQGMSPMDVFDQMGADGSSDESGAGGDRQSAARAETEEADDTGDSQAQEGPPEIVQELGGTGSAGTLGTGTSIGSAVINAALHRISGGRFGSSSGGGLIGSSSSGGRYTKRRYTHEVLPVDEEVYVFGEAAPRENASGSNASRLKLGEEALTGQFIVSDRGEGGIVKHYSRRGPLMVVAGLLVSAGALAGLLFATGIA